MGLRFRRRLKIAPGIHINLSKSGISTSLGTRGATVNLGKRGPRATVGLPGTGLFYQTKLGSRSKPAARSEVVQEVAHDGGGLPSVPEVWQSIQSATMEPREGGCLFHGAMFLALFTIPPLLGGLYEPLGLLAFPSVIVAWIFLARWRNRERQRQGDAFEAAKRSELEEIWASLVDAFGEDAAQRILDAELRIGDSRDTVEAMFGSPEEVNEKVMKTKTRHVLKFGRLGARSFAMKVTLEDGEVVSWER